MLLSECDVSRAAHLVVVESELFLRIVTNCREQGPC